MIRRRLVLFVSWGLSLTAVCSGHGISARQIAGGAGIEALYDDGSPVSFSEVMVYPPDVTDEPVIMGATDMRGSFMFRPTEPGAWTVTVDDGMGHAVTERLMVADGAVQLAGGGQPPKGYGLVTGLSLIFGVFGWGAFLRLLLRQTGKGA